MRKKNKIIQQLKKILLGEKGIVFAYVHGSFLIGEKFNDIDIAIYLDEKNIEKVKPVNFEISFSLKIEEVTKFPVDVKILNFAPLSFRYHATDGLLLFSRNELKREEFLCKTWDEYFDFLHISRLYLNEVLSG